MTKQEFEAFYAPLEVVFDDLITIHDAWELDELTYIYCNCGKHIIPGEFCATVWFNNTEPLYFCENCYEALRKECDES